MAYSSKSSCIKREIPGLDTAQLVSACLVPIKSWVSGATCSYSAGEMNDPRSKTQDQPGQQSSGGQPGLHKKKRTGEGRRERWGRTKGERFYINHKDINQTIKRPEPYT